MITLHGLNRRAEVLFKKRARLTKELQETNLLIIRNWKNAATITSNKTKEGQRARKEAVRAALNAAEAEEVFSLLDRYWLETGGGKRFKSSLLQLFM